MTEHNRKHILVTGAHRSGTTFVGRMLSLPASVGYIHEPMNPDWGLVGVDVSFPYVFSGAEHEAKYAQLFSDVLARRATFRVPNAFVANGSRPSLLRRMLKSRRSVYYHIHALNPIPRRFLVKDPLACLACEWLHREFGLDIVVLIRHPAAFVASLARVDWRFDFRNFLIQTELMEDFLAPYAHEFKQCDQSSIVRQGAILWKCLYAVMSTYVDRNPNMIAIRHEDVSREPILQFKGLYEALQLPFGRRVERIIDDHTNTNNAAAPADNKVMVMKRDSRTNVARWKRVLSVEDIEIIRRITEPLSARFYQPQDW